MSVAQLPFLTASDRPEQPDQTAALDGARSNELETPVFMSNIIPLRFESSTVLVVVQDGAPWFLLDDIRWAANVDPLTNVADSLDDDDKTVAEVDTPGAWEQVVVVSLSGVHAVAALGQGAFPARLKRWIAAEALPLLFRSSGTATVLPPRPRCSGWRGRCRRRSGRRGYGAPWRATRRAGPTAAGRGRRSAA